MLGHQSKQKAQALEQLNKGEQDPIPQQSLEDSDNPKLWSQGV